MLKRAACFVLVLTGALSGAELQRGARTRPNILKAARRIDAAPRLVVRTRDRRARQIRR